MQRECPLRVVLASNQLFQLFNPDCRASHHKKRPALQHFIACRLIDDIMEEKSS